MRLPRFADNPLRTRADVQRLATDLVAPTLPHFQSACAGIHLGENRAHYGDPAGWLEGVSRLLWGLVPLGAGGGAFEHWQRWRDALVAGTDPAHPAFWGVAGDYDQRSVEQAAFGLGLALLPQELWDPLTPAERSRVSTWLGRINDVRLVESNWLFFRVLVNLGLRHRGEPWSREHVETDLDHLERFHLGGGWYADGHGGAPFRNGRLGDYYVPMAFHYYGLVYARLEGGRDPATAARFVERARSFAQDFLHWFGSDGAALPFGRSLCYRFAQGAFWGALAFANVEALPWPVIKGLYLRHLRWWMRQPIFSETGLLTIGYRYPNLLTAESYNSPNSPYWALKALLPLALPEDHPFWTAEEAPLPVRSGVHTVPGAGLILTRDPQTQEVTAVNPGQPTLDWPRNAPHKYSKCAYSTRFGFAVPASVMTLAEGGLDSTISLSDDGRFYRTREHCEEPTVAGGVACSRWQPWSDVELRTWLVARPDCHVRIHRLSTRRRLWAAETGFAAGYESKDTLHTRADAGVAEVRTPQGTSLVRALTSGREAGTAELGANSHLLYSLSAMPVLSSVHSPGAYWMACVVVGGETGLDAAVLAGRFSFDESDDRVRLLADGAPLWTWNNSDLPIHKRVMVGDG